MIKLTKSGLSFVGLSLLLYFSSMQSSSGLLFLIFGIIVGCYVVNFWGAHRSINKIKIPHFNSIKAVEGAKITLSIEISNESSHIVGLIDVLTPFGTMFKIGALPANSRFHISPELIFKTRGVYKISELRLRSIFPFGFIRCSKRIHQCGEFIVFPAVYPAFSLKAAAFEPMIGGCYQGKHKSVFGNEFAGIRPLESGDPVKFIHWKSSSKGQGIMVREFNEELSGRVSLVIDCSPSKPNDNGEKMLDRAVRAAGSLIFSTLDTGHYVELIDLNSLNVLHVSPFSDADIVLETLARVEEREGCLNYEALEKAVSFLSKRSSICFMLTNVNEAMIKIISILLAENRIFSICLPAGFARDTKLPPGFPVYYYDEKAITEARN